MSLGIVCQIEAYVMEADARNQRPVTEKPAGYYCQIGHLQNLNRRSDRQLPTLCRSGFESLMVALGEHASSRLNRFDPSNWIAVACSSLECEQRLAFH